MKNSEKYKLKVMDLPEHNRGHLVWQLDHYTYCGFITAQNIAVGKTHDNKSIFEIFKLFDMTDHQAKIHTTQVIEYDYIKALKKIYGEKIINKIYGETRSKNE